MATRRAGLVPRTGQWTGVYTGTDLVSRRVNLAMNRRGARVTGQLSILITPSTGKMGTAAFSGTHVGGKVNLTMTVPAAEGRRSATMKINGRLVPAAAGGQGIVATTAPARGDEGGSVYGIPLNGAMVLRAGTEEDTIAFAAEDGGAWVDPGTDK